MHEDFQRKEEVKGSSERSFGIVFAAVFTIVALMPLVQAEPLRLWALGIGIVFLVFAFAWPAVLRPLNRLWLRFGLLLHAVVSPLVMALLFFGAVLPVGLIMRLTGKDLLHLRRDANAQTYWIDRRPPGPAPETMKNQF